MEWWSFIPAVLGAVVASGLGVQSVLRGKHYRTREELRRDADLWSNLPPCVGADELAADLDARTATLLKDRKEEVRDPLGIWVSAVLALASAAVFIATAGLGRSLATGTLLGGLLMTTWYSQRRRRA